MIKPDGVLVHFERGEVRLITCARLSTEPPDGATGSRVYPNVAALDHPESFIPVLTRHEAQLVAILDRQLGDEWRSRHHLDGDLPSAATLSRQHRRRACSGRR